MEAARTQALSPAILETLRVASECGWRVRTDVRTAQCLVDRGFGTITILDTLPSVFLVAARTDAIVEITLAGRAALAR